MQGQQRPAALGDSQVGSPGQDPPLSPLGPSVLSPVPAQEPGSGHGTAAMEALTSEAPSPEGWPEVERGVRYLQEQWRGGPSYGQRARWGAPMVLGGGEGGQESLETAGLQGPSRVGRTGQDRGHRAWDSGVGRAEGTGAGDRDECAGGRQQESDGSR